MGLSRVPWTWVPVVLLMEVVSFSQPVQKGKSGGVSKWTCHVVLWKIVTLLALAACWKLGLFSVSEHTLHCPE